MYLFCISYCEFGLHLQTGVNGTGPPLETADEVKLQIFFFSTSILGNFLRGHPAISLWQNIQYISNVRQVHEWKFIFSPHRTCYAGRALGACLFLVQKRTINPQKTSSQAISFPFPSFSQTHKANKELREQRKLSWIEEVAELHGSEMGWTAPPISRRLQQNRQADYSVE